MGELRVYEETVSSARVEGAYQDAIAGGESAFNTSLNTLEQEILGGMAREGVDGRRSHPPHPHC